MLDEKETEDKSEDTSKEDTNTEDSEDTSEEDTSDDNSEDEEEEEEDDSEGISDEDEGEGRKQLRKFFTDPKSIPKELRPAFKAMQGQFTRKMQAASSVVTRAQAFDKIVADPEFRTWAGNRAKNLKAKGRADSEEDDDDSGDDKLTSKSIQKMIRSAVSEAIEPMNKQRQDEQVQSEFKQFRKSHPDWQLYKDDMRELMDEHPTLTYDMAYEFATRGIDSEDMRKQSIKSKKNAKTSKPSGVQGKETTKPAKGISVRESYALAKKMLGLNKGK